MTRGTSVNRLSAPPPYVNREAYLHDVNPDGAHKFCFAAAQVQPAQNGRAPWLTPVLGSGCSATTATVQDLFGLASKLGEDTTAFSPSVPAFIEGAPAATAVSRYAMSLIRDRLRWGQAADEKGNFASTPPSWLADVVAASALLTKLYFRIKAVSDDAPYRPNHDGRAVLDDSSLYWHRLHSNLAEPCRLVVTGLQARHSDIGQALYPSGGIYANETIESLLLHVSTMLDGTAKQGDEGGRRLEIGWLAVQALAEFAWFCLTSVSKSTVLPGWSDLLLDLSNFDLPSEGDIGTPNFGALLSAGPLIRDRYLEATTQAWDRWGSTLFSATAAVLNTQAQVRLREPPAKLLPRSTAFVTSFDLDLEIALLKAGKPFSVALPVHLVNSCADEKNAHTFWITLTVPGSDTPSERERLDRLMKPQIDDLSVLTQDAICADPVVVRLAGCPLIALPVKRGASDEGRFHREVSDHLSTLLREEGSSWADWSNLQLHHAVLISEHDAVLQNTVDTAFIDSTKRLGLPATFVAEVEEYRRFWMLLGVQFQDTAIRHRIATLIQSLPRLGSHQGRLSPRSSACVGVAVNRYSTLVEQNLLWWNGFDVVRDEIASFISDLDHYAAHLVGSPAGFHFPAAGRCDVCP
jgi:hypothetical protein